MIHQVTTPIKDDTRCSSSNSLNGQLIAQGDPREIVTERLVEDVFGLKCTIIDDPVSHTPLVVPLGRDR